MRVRGNQQPAGAYSIYPQPDKAGFVCVRFFENANKIKVSIDDGDPIELWEYDEYALIVPDAPDLAADIEANYDKWLLTAKSHSPEVVAAAVHAAEVADLRQAVEILTGVDLARAGTASFTTFTALASDFKEATGQAALTGVETISRQ